MPKVPRLTAKGAESLLNKAGFKLIRSKGSHNIYGKDNLRIVVPFHANKTLHPKIIKQIIRVTNINTSIR